MSARMRAGRPNALRCSIVAFVVALSLSVSLMPVRDGHAAAPPAAPACAPSTSAFSQPTPVAVPTGPAVVSSTIDVAGAGVALSDVDVTTMLTHTFSADVDMTITSPAGTVVTLTTDNGGTNDNVFNGTVWDDDANPGGQVPYTANDGLVTDQTYVNLVAATPLVPEEALGAFIGENPNGTWTLTVSDDLAGDGGSLDAWSLQLRTTAGCLPPAPALTSTTPPSPSSNATPTVKGTAPSAATVALYRTADCSGPVVASGTAAALATGIGVPVPAGATSVISARSANAAGASPCSNALTYTHVAAPPPPAVLSVSPFVTFTRTAFTASRSGVVRVRFGARPAGAKGTISLTAKLAPRGSRRKRTTTLLRGTFKVPTSLGVNARLKLTKTARARLPLNRRISARLTVTISGRRFSKTVRLRTPARRR